MNVLLQHKPQRLPLRMVCESLDVNRSSVYARLRPTQKDASSLDQNQPATGQQPRALSARERKTVLTILNSDEFCDQPPRQVYHQLLERGSYYCSVSTMYRLLDEQGQSGERRNQRPAQHHAIPRLVATQPNEVWTWDITKLPLLQRGVKLNLYVVIDLFSRFVLAWMLSRKENSVLSQQLMQEAILRYPHAADSLTIHQDRGSPMIAHGYLDLLGELGATASHSRPRVSNDNPFSESQFKTFKYQPDYPQRFRDYAHAEHWSRDYFDWDDAMEIHSYTRQQAIADGVLVEMSATWPKKPD